MTHGDENYITTISGRKFWPLDPRAEDIVIEDIAHALSMICRFNGHVKSFYSVAQHCLIVSHHVPAEAALYGLLHDAAEAYLGDMSGPLKHDLSMQQFRAWDHWLTGLIYVRFGLREPEPPVVKQIDRLLIQDEARCVAMHPDVRPAGLRGPGLGRHISPMCPEEARHAFLYRFHQLHGATS